MTTPDDNSSAARLRSFVERIERVRAEIKDLQTDIKAIKAEAKGAGFDVKTMMTMVKLREMDEDDRAEQEALEDIYKAALGLLKDTPLGQAALDRLTRKPKPAAPPPHPGSGDDTGGNEGDAASTGTPTYSHGVSVADAEKPTTETGAPRITIDQARQMGRQAALDGHAVTDNPFPARDPNRAAWDEAWCQASGSDGMDLPDAWRRTSKKKQGEDAGRKGGE